MTTIRFTGCEFYSDIDPNLRINVVPFEKAVIENFESRGFHVERVTAIDLLERASPEWLIVDLAILEGIESMDGMDEENYSQETFCVLLRAAHGSPHPAPNVAKTTIDVYERFSMDRAIDVLDKAIAAFELPAP